MAALIATALTAFAAEMPSSANAPAKSTAPPIGMGMYPSAIPSHETFQGASGEREGGSEPATCCKTACSEKDKVCPVHSGKECTHEKHDKAVKHEKAVKHDAKTSKANAVTPAEGGAAEPQGAAAEREGGTEAASCCKASCKEKAKCCPKHSGKECCPAKHEKALKHEKTEKHDANTSKTDAVKPVEESVEKPQGASSEREGVGSQGEEPVKPLKPRYNPDTQLYDLQTIGDWLSP